MKKVLLILVAILIAFGMSACKKSGAQTNPNVELDTYDYYLLVVVSRQNLSEGNYEYTLQEVGQILTSDNNTYKTEELWSVGELVIAIEIDEVGNVYFTDLNATTSMIVNQYQEQPVGE